MSAGRSLDYNRAYALGLVLNVSYALGEGVAGVLVNSVSLLADAGHNLTDVVGLLLAWGGHRLSGRAPSRRYTYGLGGASILAALFNALLLLGAVAAIANEAVRRLIHPSPVPAGTVMAVAGVGVAVNLATALLFVRGREDLNVRGAFLHMAADAIVSAGVVAGGLGILLTGYERIDPLLSLVIAGVIVAGTWGLLREAVNLAVQAVPAGVDIDAVEAYLRGLPGVADVHDLHVWAISTTQTALTAHLVQPRPQGEPDEFLAATANGLWERFTIAHATIQVERNALQDFSPKKVLSKGKDDSLTR